MRGKYMYRFILVQSLIRSGYTLLLASSFTTFISLTFSACVSGSVCNHCTWDLYGASLYSITVKVKVKFTLEQATKAQSWSRGMSLLLL
jgi:hypothetical protein